MQFRLHRVVYILVLIIAGRLLDASPGVSGHQHYFIFLGCIALAGLLVTSWLMWLNRTQQR